MESTEVTKRRILDAARTRFTAYGFNKTTIAEIATDTSMSAGNIYRFFSCKHDIMAEMAVEYFRESEASQREVLKISGISATEKLTAFVVQILKSTHNLIVETPKIGEIVDYVHENKRDLINQHCDVQKSILAEILAEGNKSGEFDLPEILATADIMLQTFMIFTDPSIVKKYSDHGASYEDLEKMANGVSSLIVNGIRKK